MMELGIVSINTWRIEESLSHWRGRQLKILFCSTLATVCLEFESWSLYRSNWHSHSRGWGSGTLITSFYDRMHNNIMIAVIHKYFLKALWHLLWPTYHEVTSHAQAGKSLHMIHTHQPINRPTLGGTVPIFSQKSTFPLFDDHIPLFGTSKFFFF